MHLVCIMFKKFSFYFLIILLVSWFGHSFAANFDAKLRDIRGEINRDNLNKAINLLKKTEIENELQQDKINILFGDIYLKINKPQKAEEFYEKSFFASNKEIEALSLIGLAEVRLRQGKLKDAIKYSEQSIFINSDKIRPKIIIAIAKTRIGEGEEAIKILNDLYQSQKIAEIALAISDYYTAFDDTEQAIGILEDYLQRSPNNIKILDQIASLYLLNGEKEKARAKLSAKLASTMNLKIEIASKEKVVEADSSFKQEISSISKSVAKEVSVGGYKVYKEDLVQISDGRYRHFVIIEFPVTVAYKAFLDDIKNNPATKNNIKKIKDTEAFKELEKLVTGA